LSVKDAQINFNDTQFVQYYTLKIVYASSSQFLVYQSCLSIQQFFSHRPAWRIRQVLLYDSVLFFLGVIAT